jgi:hypothetical protein
MSFPDVTTTVSHWAFLPTLVRLALALGTGAFVGLEREHRGKAGARTFTFASLIGCLGGLLGNSYALLAITFIGFFVCFLNFREWRLHQNLLLTTSAALIIFGFGGVLCGKGHCLHSCRHRSDNGCLTGLEATNYWICDGSQ